MAGGSYALTEVGMAAADRWLCRSVGALSGLWRDRQQVQNPGRQRHGHEALFAALRAG